MLLGKRPRPPIKRTTSMTGITVDIMNVETSTDGSDHPHHLHHEMQNNPHGTVGPEVLSPSSANNHDNQNNLMMMNNFGTHHHHDHQSYLTAMVSPRNYNSQQQRERSRSSFNNFLETAHFLKTCGLCKRPLHPAQDIYMYRGDTAFCSSECREQQMKQDERREKIAAGKNTNNNKEESHKNNAAAATESSKKSQTVAAA